MARVQPWMGKSAQASDSPAMTGATMGKTGGCVLNVDARGKILYFPSPSLLICASAARFRAVAYL